MPKKFKKMERAMEKEYGKKKGIEIASKKWNKLMKGTGQTVGRGRALFILGLSLFAYSSKAQSPPLATCITNIILTLTDINAQFISGGSSTNSNGGSVLTVVINYHGCHTNNIDIGNAFLQCDISRHCQNNENITQCPSGAIFPITLPALVNNVTATFQPDGGCCSIQQVNTNPVTCVPPDGSCGGGGQP